MKLLLLWCVPLLSAAVSIGGSGPDRVGIISPENKAKLLESFKVNPDERRERLDNLGKKLGQQVKQTQPFDTKDRLEKSRPVHTKKSGKLEYNLFELNERLGVSPYLFHGDIDLTEEQLIQMEQSVYEGGRVKRQMPIFARKWPDNTVFFYFDRSTTERKKASVRAAHQYLEAHTCISFVEDREATNTVRVFNGSGCYTTAGMKGGIQDLSLGDGCEQMGVAAHEFIHVLGSWHMQERSDRDDYITVDFGVIKDEDEDQFSKLPPGYDYIYTPYDYSSVMHYGANTATINDGELSMVPVDGDYIYNMGNTQISFYDLQMINTHYGCNETCPAETSAQCQNGGVPNPRNCAVCNCPGGYGGALCDERPSGCGKTVTATNKWQKLTFKFGETNNRTIRDEYTHCNHWISAPSGKQVEVRIMYNFNTQCHYGCPFNGIEIKTNADQQIVNPLVCCNEFTGRIFRSALNPTPVVSFNRYYYSQYILHYRFVDGPAQPVTQPTTERTVRPTPTTTTTSAPVPTPECKDMSPYSTCLVLSGYCDSSEHFRYMKYHCGKTCGLCGKAASPCKDSSENCEVIMATGGCSSVDPMTAEYECARTCGYCDHPN